MKKNYLLLAIIIIAILIIGVLLSLTNRQKEEIVKISEHELCQNYGGTWLNNECVIEDDFVISNEEFQIIKDELALLKASCENLGGRYILSEDIIEAFEMGGECEINGVIYQNREWEWMDDLKKTCIENYGGVWLGKNNENFECEINGVIYPGNWDLYFNVKAECERSGGEFIANPQDIYNNWQCQIEGQSFREGRWSRIDEFKNSCESHGGVWIGGDNFNCQIYGRTLGHGQWERLSHADQMAELCEAANGQWNSQSKRCSGVEQEWCGEVLEQIPAINSLSYNQENRACILYIY